MSCHLMNNLATIKLSKDEFNIKSSEFENSSLYINNNAEHCFISIKIIIEIYKANNFDPYKMYMDEYNNGHIGSNRVLMDYEIAEDAKALNDFTMEENKFNELNEIKIANASEEELQEGIIIYKDTYDSFPKLTIAQQELVEQKKQLYRLRFPYYNEKDFYGLKLYERYYSITSFIMSPSLQNIPNISTILCIINSNNKNKAFKYYGNMLTSNEYIRQTNERWTLPTRTLKYDEQVYYFNTDETYKYEYPEEIIISYKPIGMSKYEINIMSGSSLDF